MKLSSRELSDWLSPMLIKELRQELRARSFARSFLWLHGLMVFSLVFSLFSKVSTPNEDAGKYLFWLADGVPLLIGIPVRASGILDKEIKANALELLFLTNLSSWAIVSGKWLALLLESILIVVSILPYTILRYFLGQVNLLAELTVLGLLFLASALLIAGRLGMASSRVKTKRASGSNAIGSVGLIFIGGYIFSSGYTLFRGIGGGGPDFLVIFFLGVLLVLYFLEFGASNIAPRNENHALRKRLLGLGSFVSAWMLLLVGSLNSFSQALVVWSVALLLLVICIGCLVEEANPYQSIYQPFVGCGKIGKLTGRLFYPGWATGSLFTLLVLTLLFWFWCSQRLWPSSSFELREGIVLFWIPLAGGIFFPLAMIKLFFPKTEKPLAWYLSIQVAITIGTLMEKTWSMSQGHESFLFFYLVPMAYLYEIGFTSLKGLSLYPHSASFPEISLFADLISVFCLLIVFWKARPEFSQIGQLERQTELSLRQSL